MQAGHLRRDLRASDRLTFFAIARHFAVVMANTRDPLATPNGQENTQPRYAEDRGFNLLLELGSSMVRREILRPAEVLHETLLPGTFYRMTDAFVYSRPPDVSVEIDGIPPSKKNGQQIKRRGRRRWVAPSDAADAFELYLKAVARRLRSLGANYVATRVTIDEKSQRTRIEVWDLGPQPAKGRCDTKRDVHNCADVVMDALQGAVFDDDRQARSVLTCYGTVPPASPLQDPTD